MATTESPSRSDRTTGQSYRKVQRQVTDPSSSALRRYQDVCVGSHRIIYTIKYEVLLGIGGLLPGAIGHAFRKTCYRGLFRRIGKGSLFGSQVALRHPCRISMGNRVVVADGAILDARCSDNVGIELGDDAVVGERALIRCKGGQISIGDRVGIGAGAMMTAVGINRIVLSNDVMIGPNAYLGGASYHTHRCDVPISQQGHDLKGGIRVGCGAWIGAGALVLDGVTIGRGAVVAAGAVVTRPVPNEAIVAGVPARVVRSRRPQTATAD